MRYHVIPTISLDPRSHSPPNHLPILLQPAPDAHTVYESRPLRFGKPRHNSTPTSARDSFSIARLTLGIIRPIVTTIKTKTQKSSKSVFGDKCKLSLVSLGSSNERETILYPTVQYTAHRLKCHRPTQDRTAPPMKKHHLKALENTRGIT